MRENLSKLNVGGWNITCEREAFIWVKAEKERKKAELFDLRKRAAAMK